MTDSVVIWVVSCQPPVVMLPPRTSTDTSTCSGQPRSTSSRNSTSVNAAVPRITRWAPARSASRTAGSERSPPPYWTGTSSSLVMRRRCSRLTG